MMKKSGPEPKKQTETKVVELDDKMKNTIHNLTLVMGDWRKLFNIPISNILIARAMNHTVRRNGLVINGYWITGRKIYLIIRCTKYRVEDTLKKFAKRLGRSVHADMWALSVMVGLGRHVGVICRVVNIILFSAIIDLSGSITLIL